MHQKHLLVCSPNVCGPRGLPQIPPKRATPFRPMHSCHTWLSDAPDMRCPEAPLLECENSRNTAIMVARLGIKSRMYQIKAFLLRGSPRRCSEILLTGISRLKYAPSLWLNHQRIWPGDLHSSTVQPKCHCPECPPILNPGPDYGRWLNPYLSEQFPSVSAGYPRYCSYPGPAL